MLHSSMYSTFVFTRLGAKEKTDVVSCSSLATDLLSPDIFTPGALLDPIPHSRLPALNTIPTPTRPLQVYTEPIHSFKVDKVPEKVFTVPVMKEGRKALEEIDKKMGLAFDDQVGCRWYCCRWDCCWWDCCRWDCWWYRPWCCRWYTSCLMRMSLVGVLVDLFQCSQ